MLLAGLVPTAYCWLELIYRLFLYRSYGSHPFTNHVYDSYFGNMYTTAFVAAAIFVVGTVFAVRGRSALRIVLYIGSAAIAVCSAIVLYILHQQNMLVTYGEFAQNQGP